MKNIEDLFVRKGNWILPASGTLGKKAENLLANTTQIEAQALKIASPSLVIPFEYSTECSTYEVLDWINHFFKDFKEVGVSSSSPDEDFGKRRPGMYSSVKIEHQDRPNTLFDLEGVLNSYYNESARLRRRKLRLSEQGMSLLVRPFIKSVWSGAFSHFGDICLITYTDPRNEMDAMQRPSIGKVWIDAKGNVLNESNTYEREFIVPKLFGLVSSLPHIPDKGWELEFLGVRDGDETTFYVMQTTPIERRLRFEVKPSEKNIFQAREIVGFGEFYTTGILYLPLAFNLDEVISFDTNYKNYCLATQHGNLTTADSNQRGNILRNLSNARVVLDIDTQRSYKRDGFAPHITQHFREEGAALAGYFTNELDDILTDQWEHPRKVKTELMGAIYSPIGLKTCADEFEQKATVELTTEIKPFVRLRQLLDGGIKQ